MPTYFHPTANVSAQAQIGEGTKIWYHFQVREQARIGQNCFISKGVNINAGVKIGDNVKIQNCVSVYNFPHNEVAALEVLSIPVHPTLTQTDLETVVETVNAYMRQPAGKERVG